MSIEEQNKMLKERLMTVEHEKFQLAQQVAKMSAEMARYRKGSLAPSSVATSCAPSPSLHPDLFQSNIKMENDDYPFSLPTPQHSTILGASLSPPSTSSAYSRSPSPAHVGSYGMMTSCSPDMTQHPAEMLCGLQCQSGAASIPPTSPAAGPQCPQSHRQKQLLCALSTQVYLMTLISAVSSHLLHPLRQIFISLRTGSPLPMDKNNSTIPPMISLLILWLISTPANLTTTPPTKVTSSATSPHTPTFRLRLLQRLLLCSPALARPLKDAAGRASRLQTSHALNRSSEGVVKGLGNRIEKVAGLSQRGPRD